MRVVGSKLVVARSLWCRGGCWGGWGCWRGGCGGCWLAVVVVDYGFALCRCPDQFSVRLGLERGGRARIKRVRSFQCVVYFFVVVVGLHGWDMGVVGVSGGCWGAGRSV